MSQTASAKEKFYITTAIVYPNGAPHIGYAYEVIAADAIARFKRLDGFDVYFQIGTDEHGQKIQQAARKEGIAEKAYVDRMAAPFQTFKDRLNCSYDRFIRTTDARPSRLQRGAVAADGGQRRHLSRPLRGLVFGTRRGLLRRGRDDRATGRHALRRSGHAGRVGRGRELLLQAVGLSGQVAGALSGPPRFHWPGEPQERDRRFVDARADGFVDQPHDVRLGHPRARRAQARHVRVGRCAAELRDGLRLSRSRKPRSGTTGRPTCTSSARTSRAFTRSTGRRS